MGASHKAAGKREIKSADIWRCFYMFHDLSSEFKVKHRFFDKTRELGGLIFPIQVNSPSYAALFFLQIVPHSHLEELGVSARGLTEAVFCTNKTCCAVFMRQIPSEPSTWWPGYDKGLVLRIDDSEKSETSSFPSFPGWSGISTPVVLLLWHFRYRTAPQPPWAYLIISRISYHFISTYIIIYPHIFTLQVQSPQPGAAGGWGSDEVRIADNLGVYSAPWDLEI